MVYTDWNTAPHSGVILRTGETYDPNQWELLHWCYAPHADSSMVEDCRLADFFSAGGEYLGANELGVEPVVRIVDFR